MDSLNHSLCFPANSPSMIIYFHPLLMPSMIANCCLKSIFRMKPFSQHTNFFSSLKQVEKRLKLEDPSPPPQLPETNYTSTESLSTPIYLNFDQPNNSSTSTVEDSEPPQAFLSSSPQFPPLQQDPSQINGLEYHNLIGEVEGDDIQRLMQLLGLSDYREKDQEEEGRDGVGLKSGSCGNSCNCEGGFYKKIVGVKGPKCVKEVERLENWIKHFANDGGEERREPLRLAHLLLGKTVFALQDCGGFGGLEFPSTIEEFLENDPPVD